MISAVYAGTESTGYHYSVYFTNAGFLALNAGKSRR